MADKDKESEHSFKGGKFHYHSQQGIQHAGLNRFVVIDMDSSETPPKWVNHGGPKDPEPKEVTYTVIKLILGISLLIPKGGGKWIFRTLKK